MEILFALLLLTAAYIGLMRGAAKVLPTTETTRQWVTRAYWASVAFGLSFWLAYVLGGWVIRFQSLFIVGLIGSGWLAGLRARLGDAPAGLHGWLTFHGWCGLPAALGIGLVWALLTDYEPVFRSHHASVELAENFTLSDNPSWTLTFYQRNELYEVEAGQVQTSFDLNLAYWRREWWQDVYDVSFDERARTVTIRKYGSAPPLTLNYHR